jgi:hypothetical protein
MTRPHLDCVDVQIGNADVARAQVLGWFYNAATRVRDRVDDEIQGMLGASIVLAQVQPARACGPSLNARRGNGFRISVA